MATSKLLVLALPYPLILLPASRSTLPVSKEIGETLLSIIEESDTLPVVAAIPLTDPYPSTPNVADPPLSEWGTAARVLRLVKHPARNSRQPYIATLHGLSRVRLIHMATLTSDDLLHMPMHDVEYPLPEKPPSHERVEKFKESALRLLDRLAKDSLHQSMTERYHKLTSMLDEITDARTSWMADVLIGAIKGEYNDKLGEFSIMLSMLIYIDTRPSRTKYPFLWLASVDDDCHPFSLDAKYNSWSIKLTPCYHLPFPHL